MQQNIKSVILTVLFALLLPVLPSLSYAASGLSVASDGGLQVGSSDDPYWFNLSGVIKADERVYLGNTDTTASGDGNLGTYIGGAFIRDLGLTLEGGVGQDFSYTIALDFDATTTQAKVDYAYLTWYGLDCLLPNLSFSFGQVVPGFCLSCASSSKWIPFMERSMGTNVFGPQPGLGASFNTYNTNYSLTVAATQQPKSGNFIRNVYGQPIKTNDLWQAAGRLTWAPISQRGKALQFGLSAHIQEYANNGLQFKANPEMRSPNTTTLLNTTTYLTSGQYSQLSLIYTLVNPKADQIWIAALNQKTVDVEVLGIYGSWSGELEYQRAYIARGTVNGAKQGKNLQFGGYHAQASYIVTGEVRPLKASNGTLGQIKPKCKYGAIEIGARYSFISLNDQDINGGRANNTTGSVSWYANNNIRVTAEYVFSLQRRHFPTYFDKRHVSGMGLRMQVVF